MQAMNGPDQNIEYSIPKCKLGIPCDKFGLLSGISWFVGFHPNSMTLVQEQFVRAEAAGLWPSTWLQATGFIAHIAASLECVIAQVRGWIKLVVF